MDRTVNAVSLFSGCGGLDLGARVAIPRLRVRLCVEREAYACALLATRMEEGVLDSAPVCTDVREFDGTLFAGAVDLVMGGFPCQDISNAGRREGIQDGNRSGLWFEYARAIRDIRPRYVFVENVSALIPRGLDIVLGDLAALGFDAEWGVFSAAEIGAPHKRERVFILAELADTAGVLVPEQSPAWHHETGYGGAGTVADTDIGRRLERERLLHAWQSDAVWSGTLFPPPRNDGDGWAGMPPLLYPTTAPQCSVCGDASSSSAVLDGYRHRTDRLRLTGNSVVWLQAAYAFRILAERLGVTL